MKEKDRLEAQRLGKQDWRLWGPYLSERAWGTVREDYSPDGAAWEYFNYDQACARTYRWSEDGIGGICDKEQRLCLALALWNGCDPILKERMFGLSNKQGNHGEDVKECFFYLDATPSHSFLRTLYKYPQAVFPYAALVEENSRRLRTAPPFGLLETGVFDQNRYWDVEIIYAKETAETIFVRILINNRGPDTKTLHVLPTLWFRNTWSWDDGQQDPKPVLNLVQPGKEAHWAVEAQHPTLGKAILYGRQQARPLFTENDSNLERLFGAANASPYVKDAFHRRLIDGDHDAVNPAHTGTKFAAWHEITCASRTEAIIEFVLTDRAVNDPFAGIEEAMTRRLEEADTFYADLVPGATREDALIFRQAMAGMIWCKQFFHFNVSQWLDGDQIPPPESRKQGRNKNWRHLRAADILTMPDNWEYPWFAAWDLAYHCMVFAHLDVDFAKEQIELLLSHRYLHPDGQIPAYEWLFDDVNPPVHAVAALKVFRNDRKQKGRGDLHFLRRVFNKLALNYSWWVNQKDSEGLNVFEGGFMGLDNISVYNRSHPLPPGYSLKQADTTGWMAMFALNMTAMALELAQEQEEYEEMAIQYYEHFLAIANSLAGHSVNKLSLWDSEDGFFKDLITTPDGSNRKGMGNGTRGLQP